MTMKIICTDNDVQVGKFEICDDFKFGILENLNAWAKDRENKEKIRASLTTSKQTSKESS